MIEALGIAEDKRGDKFLVLAKIYKNGTWRVLHTYGFANEDWQSDKDVRQLDPAMEKGPRKSNVFMDRKDRV